MLEQQQQKESVFCAFISFLINFGLRKAKMYISNFTPCYIFCLLSSHAWLFSRNGKRKCKCCNIPLWFWVSCWEINAYVQITCKATCEQSRCTSTLCSVKAGIWTRLLPAYIRNMGDYSFMYLKSWREFIFLHVVLQMEVLHGLASFC